LQLLSELRRRNVFRMAVLYLGAAWLVMQVVDVLEDPLRLPDWTGGALLAVLAVGFPIAVVLSWFFEVTPEGVTLDEDVKPGGAVPAAGRRLDFVVIAVLAAAVLIFAFDKWWTGPPPERSVAVLPFVSMSSSDDTAHLGAGVADTILNTLVTIPELHVASRTSSFQPRLQGLSIREVAALLGVTTILEGSIQRQGDRLRITAQLIDGEDDNHLWSSNFDREYGDIFAIQDEIADAVASALQIAVLETSRQRIDRAGTDNLAAFEAYSRAIDNLRILTTESFGRAVEQLQQAVEFDPTFARAHALLGVVYLDEYCCDRVNWTVPERKDLARDAATTALRIAPGLSTALTVLGRLDADRRGDLFREAVANDPNDTIALQDYAFHLFDTGETDAATELAEHLIRLDPLAERHYVLLSRNQRQQGMTRKALETLANAKQKIPNSVALRDAEHWCYRDLGDYSSMIRVKHETLALDPKESWNRWMIAQDYLTVGMPEVAERWWERAIDTAPEWEQDILRLMLRTTMDVYYRRNDSEVFESMWRWVSENGRGFASNRFPPHFVFTEYGDRLGRLDEVLSAYQDRYPQLFTNPPEARSSIYGSIVGEALIRAGDRERGEPLVREVLSLAKFARPEFARRFEINALLHLEETNAALDDFRELNPARKFWLGELGQRFVMENSPVWAPIRALPEYTTLLEELDRNAAEHRRLLQTMALPVR
jgi:TolB-like protein